MKDPMENLKELREHFEDLAEKKGLTLEDPMENLKESRKQLDDLLRRTERLGL